MIRAVVLRCVNVTRRRRATLPFCALHHLLGHALGAALLPFLLHQLLKLHLAGVDATLVGGATDDGLQHWHRWCGCALLDLTARYVSCLLRHHNIMLATVTKGGGVMSGRFSPRQVEPTTAPEIQTCSSTPRSWWSLVWCVFWLNPPPEITFNEMLIPSRWRSCNIV